MERMNILVTGSRDWPYLTVVYDALARLEQKSRDSEIRLLHGDCQTGADYFAKAYARQVGWELEPYPPDWKAFGKAAGPIRNEQMVKILRMRPNPRCFAFMLDQSRGTAGTIRMIQDARPPIPWDLYTAQSDAPGLVLHKTHLGKLRTIRVHPPHQREHHRRRTNEAGI